MRVDSITRQGFARVLDRSVDWGRGFGTKTYPAWLVEFQDGERGWYNGISLRELTKAKRAELS